MYSSNTVKMGLLVNFLTGRQSFLFVRLELFVAACLKPLFLLEYCLAVLTVQLLGSLVSAVGLNLSVCVWMVIVAASLTPLTWLGTPKATTTLNIYLT